MNNFVLRVLSNAKKTLNNSGGQRTSSNSGNRIFSNNGGTKSNSYNYNVRGNQNSGNANKTNLHNNIFLNNTENVNKTEDNKKNQETKKYNLFKPLNQTEEENSMIELRFDEDDKKADKNKNVISGKTNETTKADKTNMPINSPGDNIVTKKKTKEEEEEPKKDKVVSDEATKILERNKAKISDAERLAYATHTLVSAYKGEEVNEYELESAYSVLNEAISQRHEQENIDYGSNTGMKELSKNYNALLDMFEDGHSLTDNPDYMESVAYALDTNVFQEGASKADVQSALIVEFENVDLSKENKALLEKSILTGDEEALTKLYKNAYGDLYSTAYTIEKDENDNTDMKIGYKKISDMSDEELKALFLDEGRAYRKYSMAINTMLGDGDEAFEVAISEYASLRIKNDPNAQKAIVELQNKGYELNPTNVEFGTKLLASDKEINKENFEKLQSLVDNDYYITEEIIEFADILLESDLPMEEGYSICKQAYDLKNAFEEMSNDEAFALAKIGFSENSKVSDIARARDAYKSNGNLTEIAAQLVLESAEMEQNEENIKKATNLINAFNTDIETVSNLMQVESNPEEAIKALSKIGAIDSSLGTASQPEQGNVHPNVAEDAIKLIKCYAEGTDPIDEFVPKIKSANAALNENSSIKVGDVFQVEGEDHIRIKTSDDKTEELNISRDTYFKLFPPIGRYGSTQDRIGNCWEITAINSVLNDPEARYSVLKLYSEEDGNIQISFPNGQYEKIVFKNGEMPEETRDMFYSNGALGVMMLEYADGLEMQAENVNKATDYLGKRDVIKNIANFFGSDADEPSEISKFTQYMDENNGNVYVWFEGDELKYESYEEYKKNHTDDMTFDVASTQYRNGGWPSTFFNRIGYLDASECSLDAAFNPFAFFGPNLNNAKTFDDYIITFNTKFVDSESGEIELNKEHGIYSSHAYRLEAGAVENGQVKTFKVINPWGIMETELTPDEIYEYGYNISYAKKV